jgi:uncharacterized membrane protein (DUF106 family)
MATGFTEWITEIAVSIFDPLLGWAVNISPLTGLIIISFLIALISTLVYKFATDQNLMKNIKEEMKDLKNEIKKAANDPAKMDELNKRSIEKSMTQMKHSMRPTLWTIIPFLLVFVWLRVEYTDLAVKFLWIDSWFWIYFLFSIIFSLVLKKILKVH